MSQTGSASSKRMEMNSPIGHDSFIRRAIEIADGAVRHGNHPFGALLVRNGQIVLEAENTVNTEHDVTTHAELNLVRLAVRQCEPPFLADCTLYASTEPCAMCSGAIYWAGIGTVVFACSAQRLAHFAGDHLSVPCRSVFAMGVRETTLIGPILESEAEQAHASYWPQLKISGK